ncbi:histone-like nucleoid-structuring protein Lsr2 [Streptomyces sp. NPDC048332]|uniref:Lsr2 family DNA-binding protein n=1 Tax=Streptomyces sp. NPDC048332 TaxID=3154619 RepID=UPI003426AB27
MTIAALQQLLAEELPHVPRHPAPLIPHTARKRQTMMSETPVPVPAPHTPQDAPSAGLHVLPTGGLLAWAEKHTDRSVVRQAEQARTALAALRTRYAADEEIAKVDAEEQDLQRRLEAVRARKAQLRPRKKTTVRDYDVAAVRAWAAAHGHEVPSRGRIPGDVLQAWREQNGGAE